MRKEDIECKRRMFPSTRTSDVGELNLRLIHVKKEAKELRADERIIHVHEHRHMSGSPSTARDSICACAKRHG